MDTEIKLTLDEAANLAQLIDIGRMMQDKVAGSLRARLVEQIEQIKAREAKEKDGDK